MHIFYIVCIMMSYLEQEIEIYESLHLLEYVKKTDYLKTLLTKEVFQNSSVHTLHVLIEEKWWEENKEEFFKLFTKLSRQEKEDIKKFIEIWYNIKTPLKRNDYQKQHITEHKVDLLQNLQKYYPENYSEYRQEIENNIINS